MNIGIVRALFNNDITEAMLTVAEEEADALDLNVVHVLEVPGAHDVALATQKLLQQNRVHGVVALGALIKGATDHDEILAETLAEQLMTLSCEHRKPIGFGIVGPNVSREQAEERVEKYAEQAVKAVYDTHNELKDL